MTNPGLPNQDQVRNGSRVGGLVLTIGGVLTVLIGFGGFVSGMVTSDIDGPDPKMMGLFFVMFAVGGFLSVIGFGLLRVGYLGAAARYGSGELSPVLKDTADYLTDGEGILGVGRTVDDSGRTPGSSVATGPFCSRCGIRNDTGAKFCDACGSALQTG